MHGGEREGEAKRAEGREHCSGKSPLPERSMERSNTVGWEQLWGQHYTYDKQYGCATSTEQRWLSGRNRTVAPSRYWEGVTRFLPSDWGSSLTYATRVSHCGQHLIPDSAQYRVCAWSCSRKRGVLSCGTACERGCATMCSPYLELHSLSCQSNLGH